MIPNCLIRLRVRNVRAGVPHTFDVPDRQRWRALAWLGTLPVILASPAHVLLQDYPLQSLRLVVPATKGSAFDALVRVPATRLQQQVGREVGVKDYPAASGMATGGAVTRAPSDDHTLLLQQTTFTVRPTLGPTLYDSLHDFQSIAMVATLSLFLAIDACLPICPVTDLFMQTSGESVMVNCDSDIVGTWLYLVAEQFVRGYAFHVPYAAVYGEAGLVQQILVGRMTMCLACYPSVAAAAVNGQLWLLGMTGGTRSRFAPVAPTLCGGGLVGFDRSV